MRRKADGAKELVREFVGKWQDNAAVVGDVTHSEMKGELEERLGWLTPPALDRKSVV